MRPHAVGSFFDNFIHISVEISSALASDQKCRKSFNSLPVWVNQRAEPVRNHFI